MADETQPHLETAVSVLSTGRKLFDDLVEGSEDQLVENLWSLSDDALRAIVFERVLAERKRLGH